MKIMLAYNRSDAAQDALQLAIAHGRAFKASVLVVTAMEGGPAVSREQFARAERELRFAENELKGADVPCKTHLVVMDGSPAEMLLSFARKNGVDEIIMGVQKRSRVGKLLLGSTAQFLILNADCPVVTVK